MAKSNHTGGQRDRTTHYEVRRLRLDARRGVKRDPYVETFHGLDRARLAALGYALDGPESPDKSSNGTIEIWRIRCYFGEVIGEDLVDVVDERVAFRFLNDIDLPRAEKLTVPIERLQEEVNRLERLGID